MTFSLIAEKQGTYVIEHRYTFWTVKGACALLRAEFIGAGVVDDGGVGAEYPAVTVGVQPGVGIVV